MASVCTILQLLAPFSPLFYFRIIFDFLKSIKSCSLFLYQKYTPTFGLIYRNPEGFSNQSAAPIYTNTFIWNFFQTFSNLFSYIRTSKCLSNWKILNIIYYKPKAKTITDPKAELIGQNLTWFLLILMLDWTTKCVRGACIPRTNYGILWVRELPIICFWVN